MEVSLDSSSGVPSPRQQRITTALTLAMYADGLAAAVNDTGDSATPVTQSGAQPRSHAAAQLFCLSAHLAAHHGDLAEDVLACDLAAQPWPAAVGQAASGTQHVLSQIGAGIPWWRAAPAHRGVPPAFPEACAPTLTTQMRLCGSFCDFRIGVFVTQLS